MPCHLIEPVGILEEKLRLPLAWRDDKHGGPRDSESLMHSKDSTDRALPCLTAAAENLARVLAGQHFSLPGVGLYIHAYGELNRVGGNVSAPRHLPRGLNPTQLPL